MRYGTPWERDDLQFPRLLAEIRAIGLTNKQYEELAENMDLTMYEIDDLLDRADTKWQDIKADTDANGYHGT